MVTTLILNLKCNQPSGMLQNNRKESHIPIEHKIKIIKIILCKLLMNSKLIFFFIYQCINECLSPYSLHNPSLSNTKSYPVNLFLKTRSLST
jgi:hypothetical protein